MCDTGGHLAQKSEGDFYDSEWLYKKIDAELSDENMSKQEAIVKAVKRLGDEMDYLVAFVKEGEAVEGREDTHERLSRAGIGEFLNELPEIINGFAMRIFHTRVALGNMLYVRTVRRSPDGD